MKKITLILLISLLLTACTNSQKEISLYYYKQALDPNFSCQEEAFLPVFRKITPSSNIYFDTINLLISGDLSKSEIKEGFSTEFPHPDFKIINAELNQEGTLFLEFTEVANFTSGGSLRMQILRNQIEKTALQFPEVENVIMNNDEIFQP